MSIFLQNDWKEIVEYLNHEFNKCVLFGKFAKAFKVSVYEYELRTEYCEILQLFSHESTIYVNLSKVLYAMGYYKESLTYCQHGMQFIQGDNINLLVLRTIASECENQCINGSSEIGDLLEKKAGSTSIEDLPHRQVKWFADLSDFENITTEIYNNRVSSFHKLEKIISGEHRACEDDPHGNIVEGFQQELVANTETVSTITRGVADGNISVLPSKMKKVKQRSAEKMVNQLTENNPDITSEGRNSNDKLNSVKPKKTATDVVSKMRSFSITSTDFEENKEICQTTKEEDHTKDSEIMPWTTVLKKTNTKPASNKAHSFVQERLSMKAGGLILKTEDVPALSTFKKVDNVQSHCSEYAYPAKSQQSIKRLQPTTNLHKMNDTTTSPHEIRTKLSDEHPIDHNRTLCDYLKKMYDFQWGCSALKENRCNESITVTHKPHSDCPADVLLCHPLDTIGNWMVKVRVPVGLPTAQKLEEFKICSSLGSNIDCSEGDNCFYSHNQLELTIWNTILDSNCDFLTVFEILKETKITTRRRKSNSSSFVELDVKFMVDNQASEIKPHSIDVLDLMGISPLFLTYKFHLSCIICHSTSTNEVTIHADCSQNIVLCRNKNITKCFQWDRVRTRPKNLPMNANQQFSMCREYPLCPRSIGCTSAHSETERTIWNEELKQKTVLLPDHLIDHLSYSLITQSFRELDLPLPVGRVYVWIGCGECVTIVSQGYVQVYKFKHDCELDIVLFREVAWTHHFWITIRPRLDDYGIYELCRHIKHNNCWSWKTCKFAHSELEFKLWQWDSNYKKTRVINLDKILRIEQDNWQKNGPRFNIVPAKTIPNCVMPIMHHLTGSKFHSDQTKEKRSFLYSGVIRKRRLTSESEAFSSQFKVHYICGICFRRYHRITYKQCDSSKCNNNKDGHIWDMHKQLMVFDEHGKPHALRPLPLPFKTSTGKMALLCNSIELGKPCLRTICTYAHSDIEKRCWTFLSKHGKDVTDIITEPYAVSGSAITGVSKVTTQFPANTKSALPSNATWGSINVTDHTAAIEAMKGLHDIALYCFLCNKTYQNEIKFEEHCHFVEHIEKLDVDELRVWACRQPHSPPPYKICQKHLNKESCPFSKVASNFCPDGHSQAEIDEWNERITFLREVYNRKPNDILNAIKERAKIIQPIETDSTNFAKIERNGSKVVSTSVDEKGKKFRWTFTINSEKNLKNVALMKTEFLFYFRLRSPYTSSIDPHVCSGEHFLESSMDRYYYEVEVDFLGSKSLGTFRQEIIFDFGNDLPLIKNNVTVHVGITEMELNNLTQLNKILTNDGCWTTDNPKIHFHWISKQQHQKVIKADDVLTNLQLDLNESTYFKIMDKLVAAEELMRQSILSGFRLQANATLMSQLASINDNTPIYPKHQKGLFAKLHLNFELNEDFDIAELLIRDCEYALVALPESISSKVPQTGQRHVYEVDVVSRYNYGFEGINQHSIYLCLSPSFVKYWFLTPDTVIPLEVQFTLTHDKFASWTRCLKMLAQKEMIQFVYPNLMSCFNKYFTGVVIEEAKRKIPQLVYLEKQWKQQGKNDILEYVKNDEQIAVLRHVAICAVNKTHWIPPLVIYGPFGTGKTRTIAEAVCILLTQKGLEETKMLICTQSNSTADLYLKLFETHGNFEPDTLKYLVWRIIPSHTKAENLLPSVKPYVRFTENNELEELTVEKLHKIRVVISTVNSVSRLTRLVEENSASTNSINFTHIFLDEAAQGLEAEMLQPLCLASKMTCVVVAGDHHQIKPTLYYTAAEQLQYSYLERLYNYYESQESATEETIRSKLIFPKILFTKNYRCHPDILSFLSSAFYALKPKLQPCANVPESLFKPMYFVTAVGDEKIMSGGISISNVAEIVEVVNQVKYFWSNWPDSWGEKDIGVVCDSFNQVKYIRENLKAERRYPKNRLSIGKTITMHGKEFKLLIISTVRGRNLLDQPLSQQRKLGFLDDARLINTAISRARYCVVVVGDPVVLCSIGKCKEVWQQYIDHCFDRQSFLPECYTNEHLKSEIVFYRENWNILLDEQ